MRRRKVRLSNKKERCLLSDVLPYEIPISFSNRHFYWFILRNRVTMEKDAIFWLKGSRALNKIIALLFALPDDSARMTTVKRRVGEREVDFIRYQLNGKGLAGPRSPSRPERFMTPFSFKIRHKEAEFRDLTVPHPRSQIQVVEFYEGCKETILHYTSRSTFTIRAPVQLAKFQYFKDSLHFQRLSTEPAIIEQAGQEYENLRSFFVYRAYSNIHKFYESYRYHRAEKKYNGLMKLDVSKCFDSIYTHSIGWAVFGKDALKQALGRINGTFPDRFDRLLQDMNQGETNGIIIGPEFSRVFAEVILQSVDREVEAKLSVGDNPLMHKTDYEVFRYVDDYFVFYNREVDRCAVVDELRHTLREYKLYLNEAKAVVYSKPIITEITMAKQQISSLLEEKIRFRMQEVTDDLGELATKGSIYVNSSALITRFKTIIKTCNVQYQDMLNYTLSIVERKCEGILKGYLCVSEEFRSPSQLVNAIRNVLEFVFFVYSVSPRVNNTIRLCGILRVVSSFLESGHVIEEQVQMVHKQIYDDVCFILRKNRKTEYVQVESLYLLLALSQLGKDYWLEEQALRDYLGIQEAVRGSASPDRGLNHFSITVSLFYMKDKLRYSKLRRQVVKAGLDQIRIRRDTCHKDAEMVFLLFDLISCPYLEENEKAEALAGFGVTDPALTKEIVEYGGDAAKGQVWFTSWHNFDFGRELDAKRSQEVY